MLYFAKMSAILCLACSECNRKHEADILQTVCTDCRAPLLAQYDLRRCAGSLDPSLLRKRPQGIWRWHELLPVRKRANWVSLGEGDTPQIELPKLAQNLGLRRLSLKDEGRNPTGTFKARGLAVAMSKARELGIRIVVIPTAGNAGGATATYAARAGMQAHVYMPTDAPTVNQREVQAVGAELHLVEGLISDAGRAAAREAQGKDWFNLSTFKEPYRVEGKKTMGFELAEDGDWSLPDVILYPTGGGTGLVGMWKAFDELEELGWIDSKRPRMVSVQSEGCAPVVKAFAEGRESIEPWREAATLAHGLRVPHPYADRQILRVLRESRGTAVAISDAQIQSAQQELAQHEGVLACYEGAATIAALKKLIQEDWFDAEDDIVLFNTGTGLKDLS